MSIKIANNSFVSDHVRMLHPRTEDLIDGDLQNRIDKFLAFELKSIPVDIIRFHEFELCDDLVREYAVQYHNTGIYPPIVYDAVENSMIDGLHRANALIMCGLKEINAYVGTASNIDPSWSPVDEFGNSDSDEIDETTSPDSIDQDRMPLISITRPRM